MTTLYRPVLIQSAEQAEALPVGTVALPASGDPEIQPYTKTIDGMWVSPWELSDDLAWGAMPSAHMVGDYALVPIEAEEERDDEWADYGGANRRRLVTPWEAS